MNFLDEDDRNAAIELLKANALATANNNSLHTTIKEEPQGNSEAQSVIPNITQTDSETEQVDFVKHEENNITLACIHFHPDCFHNAYGYFLS
jgi:hypothetical protein